MNAIDRSFFETQTLREMETPLARHFPAHD
jgi:hypothetical protein